jgi:hypothetical protein
LRFQEDEAGVELSIESEHERDNHTLNEFVSEEEVDRLT